MPDLIIETATAADSAAIANLQYRSHTISFREFARLEWCDSRKLDDYLATWASHLESASDDRRTFVAREDGKIVGMVSVDESKKADGSADLHGMHVDPDIRGRGIGRLLMEAVHRYISDRGYHQTTLGCLEPNTYARKFYEQSGFAIVKHFHEEPYGWTYLMRYELSDDQIPGRALS